MFPEKVTDGNILKIEIVMVVAGITIAMLTSIAMGCSSSTLQYCLQNKHLYLEWETSLLNIKYRCN